MKKNLYLLLLLIIGSAFFGCKTQKSRDDISPLKKFYHNTTSEFNGYYNADVLLTESIAKLNLQQQDNYNQTLEIYEYMGAPNYQEVGPDLDKAMEKMAIVISLHRPSHWTDDCYLLMGKSQFLKRDYESAEETFKYLLDEFPEKTDDAAKKRRGKKKKASKKEKKKEAKVAKKERDETRADKKEEAKRKKKEREKERKRKIKESKKRKKGKKGKKKSSSKKETATDEKVEEKKTEVEETPKEEKKKKEVVDKNPNSPDKYFMKHRPAFREAQLWYGRTLIERSKFDAADRIFRKIEADPKTFKDVRRELAPAMAYSALEQKNYDRAITYLKTAIELADDKYLKARYAYIIAQLQQKNKNNSEAYAYFGKALKFRPGYEMEFNAKLQIAQNAWASGQSSPEQIIKSLNKMLNDGKNVDFRDQIYFTLAQVALQQGDKKEAIKNLQLSARNNAGNLNQKTEAYYQLATLFLDDESYVDAKLYFDSTLAVMPDIDDRHKDVVKYALNLADIATNIIAIQLQDSLLTIMKMTDEEKKALALKIKQDEEKQRIKDAQAAATSNASAKSTTTRTTVGKNIGRAGAAVAGAGKVAGQGPIPQFFAYDDRAKKRGLRGFQRKWGGSRPDVDNWRISSKIEDVEIEDTDEEKNDFITTTDLTDEQVDEILADVPSNPVERTAANKIVEDALYQLGKLYRDNLENNEKSVESLEELLKRYPETDYKIEAWYYLYIAHTALGNTAEAKVYYDKIINEAPNSLYATVLKNPNYYNELESEDAKLGKYYDQAYSKFTNGNYKGAFVQAQGAAEKFGPKNQLSAKFALLSAMSMGSLEGKDAYIKSLKDVIAQYPDTEEQKRAREMLRLLGDESSFAKINDGSNNEATSENKGVFKVDDKDLHYVIVALEGDADLGKAKSDVGNYHRKYFKNESMRVSNIYLGKDQKDRVPIIVIRRFKGKGKAMEYYEGVKKNAKDFLGINFKYQIYPITQNNYRQILKERSLKDYPEFFDENYK